MADTGEGLARPVPTILFFDVFREPLSWVRMTPPPTPPSPSFHPKVWIRHWGITITLRIFRKVMLDPAAETQGLQYLLYSILQIL